MSHPRSEQDQAGVLWHLAHASQVPEGDGWLIDAEREAQQRFVLSKRREEWRLGRFGAKALLETYTGMPAPGIGILARGPDDGYPVVVGAGRPAPHLSLTHRDGLAVAAVSRAGVDLGCDLERVEPRPSGFAADWFTGAELRRVESAAPADRDLLVTLIWSIKEAALKAVGQGLRLDTRTVETSFDAAVDGRDPGGRPSRSWYRVSARMGDDATLHGWWRPLLGMVLVVVAPAGELENPPLRSWPKSSNSPGVHAVRNYGAHNGGTFLVEDAVFGSGAPGTTH